MIYQQFLGIASYDPYLIVQLKIVMMEQITHDFVTINGNHQHQISHTLSLSLMVHNNYHISHFQCCGVDWVQFGSLLLGASQLVIALHLIMSGDVELNPGPVDTGMPICMFTIMILI